MFAKFMLTLRNSSNFSETNCDYEVVHQIYRLQHFLENKNGKKEFSLQFKFKK